MKKLLYFVAFATSTILAIQCDTPAPEKTELTVNQYVPVPLPDPGIPGFTFPEDSNIINGWINAGDNNSIYRHGWGLWVALNMNSGEQYDGQELRVFETWVAPQDISQVTKEQEKNKEFSFQHIQRGRSPLEAPRQLNRDVPKSSVTEPIENGVNVKYDPAAALFAVENQVFNASVLDSMLNAGAKSIPDFPAEAITLKPVFQVIRKQLLDPNGLYRLKVWSGPPPVDTIVYPPALWEDCVYVDINNQGQGSGDVDSGCKGATPQTTYNLNDFVNFTLDEAHAKAIRENLNLSDVQAGDHAILVGMHVTTKEIKRWTWQTFWWTPNPEVAVFPSLPEIVAARPSQLQGAPRHYAMSVAYNMINPPQPETGGNNKGQPLYAYNPYLEPELSKFTQLAVVDDNGTLIRNMVGMRSNCMSCHFHANYNPNNVSPSPSYIGDTYVSYDDPIFNGTLQLDFAWSIQGNINTASAKK